MATLPTYASAETVATAFDVAATADQLARLYRLADVASRSIEGQLNRRFYPLTAERSWRWPTRDQGRYCLQLPDDLISATTLEFDDTAITGHVLEPRFDGPPYTAIDLTDATGGGAEIVTLNGVWGHSNDTRSVTTLTTTVNTSITTVVVDDSSSIGTGDMILVESERMVVTARAFADTTANTSGALTAAQSDVTVPVTSGALVKTGETILIDSERMRVLSVAGNNLTVRRAVDGSVLATHANPSDVYAPRSLTVVRAALGTTAAAHTAAVAISRLYPHPLIVELCVAETQTLMGQEQAGWNMTVGEGEGSTESTGRQVGSIRKQARQQLRRWNYGAV